MFDHLWYKISHISLTVNIAKQFCPTNFLGHTVYPCGLLTLAIDTCNGTYM